MYLEGICPIFTKGQGVCLGILSCKWIMAKNSIISFAYEEEKEKYN